MNRYEFELQFLASIIMLECSLSACVCSKTGLPDPDGVFRSMVPSETCNWDEFTATPVQALADTSFKKSFSGAQLLVWEVLQLSL